MKCVLKEFDNELSEKFVTIEQIRILGKGRAATVSLVKITEENGKTYQSAEKLFKPGFLTRFIYSCFFQSPFAYRSNEAAIKTAGYRRKIAAFILQSNNIDLTTASALYYRWDTEEKAYVLGTEFIPGCGVAVDPPNKNRFLHFFKNIFKKKINTASEFDHLLVRMKEAEHCFRRNGLVGSGWQVAASAIVSTANFIIKDKKITLVDLESGIPAILVPYYAFRSFFSGNFPYFDDLDASSLKKFKDNHLHNLQQEEKEQLNKDFDNLLKNHKEWKESEISFFKNPFSMLSNQKRTRVKNTLTQTWFKEGIIDEKSKNVFLKSTWFFTRLTFLVGLFPGRLGRLFRQYAANMHFRKNCTCFFTDKQFRQQKINAYIQQKTNAWLNSERIPKTLTFHYFFGFFFIHLLLSKCTFIKFQRFLADKQWRKDLYSTMILSLISEKFQAEYAKYRISIGIHSWEKLNRLAPKDVQKLKEATQNSMIQEYLQCFAMHASLKLFTPITVALKFTGIYIFFTYYMELNPELGNKHFFSIEAIKSLIITAINFPLAVLLIFNTSIIRTVFTFWRMLSLKKFHIPYGIALIAGIFPIIGSFAYSLQIYWKSPRLSYFLLRYFAANAATRVPIYGCLHSRLENWAVKAIDLIVFFLEIFRKIGLKVRKPKDDNPTNIIKEEWLPHNLTQTRDRLIQKHYKEFKAKFDIDLT